MKKFYPKSLLSGLYLYCLILSCFSVCAQEIQDALKVKQDTNYVQSYSHKLTTRIYLSNKYTNYGVRDYQPRKNLVYRPNDRLNVGFGINYYFLGLNIGFTLPFGRRDEGIYGRTKYLDAQSHIYLSKFTADIYLQSYKGYYLANPQQWDASWRNGMPYPQREDMHTLSTGINVQFILNHKHFSYRAAYVQNEWQKKSAGTMLIGGEVYMIHMRADSSIIPAKVPGFFNDVSFRRSRISNAAFNLGYAYTFVYKSRWFVTASLVGGIGMGMSRLTIPDGEDLNKITLHFNSTVRLAAGYNSRRYFIGISFVNLSSRSLAPVPRSSISFDTGNVRFNVCRRFTVAPPKFLKKKK